MIHGFRVWRAVIAFLVVGGLAFPMLYGLAILVSPPHTPDGHPVMPIGQAAFAIAFAPALGVIAGFVFGRRR
jgi:hypothetical protein